MRVVCCSFEVRSPAQLLREAGSNATRSPNAYEVTPNPLYDEQPSPRDRSPSRADAEVSSCCTHSRNMTGGPKTDGCLQRQQ